MSIAEELSPVYETPEDETTITPKVEFPEELPQKMTDPLGEEFKQKAYEAEEVIQAERDAEREAEAEAERQSRREVMGSIERDLLDTRDRTNGEKVSAISKFISASGGKAIRSEAQFNQGMDRAWKALGGEGIAPSTDAVFDKLQQQSIKGKQINDKATDMFHRGTKSVYSKAPVDPTFELMTTPMSKEERKQFSEAYKKGVAAQRARLGDANIASYHTILEQVNTGIDFDEIAESVADHTVGMDGRAKITYLAGMRESLDELPQEKRRSLIDKIAHNARVSMELSGDLVTHTAKQAIKGVRGAAAGFFNESQRETNPIAKRAQLLSETAMHYTDMERSVKDILMSKAEPLDYVTDENSIGRFFEEAAYQVPQVAVSIGTVAAPMILSGVVGVGGYALQAARGASAVAGFSMSASEVAESKRQGYLEGGADFDTASKKSNSLATYAQTLPHYFLERFQGGAITRKSKFADTLMNKLDSKLRNRAARFVSKYTAQATIQTAEEMGQNIYTEMVKDITNVFDSEMSDVVWSNGKDGVFDEFWAQSAVTFLSMSPFAAGSAAGLMDAENRAAAWAKLPDLHLKAYGFDQKSIDNLKNAETPREKTRAYTDAQAIRDGFSEESKEAIDIINTAAEAQAEALLQEQYTGDFPMVNVSFVDGKPSFKVYEPKTDELLLDTDSSDEATAAALEWADKKADEDDARFIFLNSLMKASAQMTERDPKSAKRLDTGEIMTALKNMAKDPEHANRVFSQAQRAEIRNGGDGDIANLVFGKRVYGSNRMSIDESRQIKLIDTIYAGGNIMTLIHEEGHGLFKTGVETGVIDYNDTIRLLRSLDKVMGDRMSKATSFGKSKTAAQPLRFLDTDGEPSFMQVDEAVAELWETLILGEGRMGSMRELIKANMKAQAQMGVGNTITNFVRALRHSMGLALTRAMVMKKAIRDGDIKKEDIDKFRAQMQGTTEQEQITDAAKKEFDKTLKPALDDTSMSIGQDASYLSAVESGDVETQQRMVDEAAKAAGYDSPKVYHGTDADEIVSFDPQKAGSRFGVTTKGYFFTDNKRMADFTSFPDDATRQLRFSKEGKKAAQQRTVSAYLKTGKVLTKGDISNLRGFKKKTHFRSSEFYDDNVEVIESAVKTGGYNTVHIKSQEGDLYAVFNPNQIKSADPVTYDSDGNVIPLSQRFDASRDEISFSMGAVPEAIENAADPIVKHIFLKEDGKFYEKVKDGYVVIEQSLDQFEGMAIMLHQPDGAMAGTVEVDGEQVVAGKGGVYYPVMFGDQGYFWASTRDAAKTMAKNLNAISRRNNGTILMALTSAPIEKMFSSTTMATGALDLFHTLAKNPKKYGVTKEELNKAIATGSQATLVKETKDEDTGEIVRTVKQFPHKLKETDSLAKNLKEMKKNLLPDASIFGQRGAFVQHLAAAMADHMKLPTQPEVKKLDAKGKAAYEVKKQQALNIANLLAGETNLYNKSLIPKGTLAMSSVMQGMADLFAEPLVKTFQEIKGSQSGRIYAVLEMKGEVEAYETEKEDSSGKHESYPFALRSTSGQTPIVHVLKNSNRWQDVVYAAPNKKNKDDKNEVQPPYDGNTNPVKKADESSMFPASAGVSMREMILRKPDEGAESIKLSFSMDDTARQGIMESIEERVTLPEIKAEMLGDAFRNVQKLVDQKNKLQEELKTINDDGKTQAVVNLEEKLRQIEVEIDTMDQAYDNDVKEIEALHEIRKGDIGEQVVSEFAHRIEKAKPQQKKQLTKEAKARESERKKAETTRFKLEKKNLKERLKTEKANLENEAERVRTKLETKSAMARRKLIRDMLVTYEAILMSLNTSERGKMGSSVRLADISSDQQILDFFEQKLDRLERVMDSFIGKEFNKSKDQLMERAKVKTQAGKKDKGKLKAQIHEVFDAANRATKMDESELAASVAYIDTLIEGKEGETELTGAEVDILRKQKVMMQLFGNWKELTNPEKEAALVNGWREFEYNFALSKLEQAEDRAKRLAEVETAIQSTGVTSEEANLIADLKEGESHKLMSKLRATAYGLMDFEQFLTKVFGKDSRILDFVVREQRADAQKIDRMRSHQDALSDMFEEVAGTSNLGVKAAKLQYEMQQKKYLIKSGQRSLTHMQMIQARLMWRQVDGRRHMEGRFDADGNRTTSWGYDQKFMDEIDSLMTPEARAVEDFLIEQYKDEWADLNAVHQRMQNATLPRNDMYAPLTVEPARGVKDPDPITGQSIKTMKGADAFLLRRNKGAVAEPKFRDALSTFLAHKTQVEHYMAYAELNRDINNIVGNREARKSIRAKTGDEGIKTLDGWTNVFENNGLQQSYADTELANFMNRAVSRTSQAILFGRLSVLAIQSTQIGAAAAQMPTMSYAKRLGMLMTGQLEFKKAFNSAFIQRRMDEAPPAVKLAMQHMASGKPNLARAAAERMGTLISGTDAFFTAGTYAIIFDYLTSNKGLADKDAHAEAERLTEQVAQPMRMGRKSLMEMQFSRQPTAKLAWAFASEPRQKMMLLAFNISENGLVSKEAGRAAITTVAFGGVFASLIRTIAADVRDDDDEEIFDAKYWNPTRLALQSMTAPFQGIPVFGDIAEYLVLSSAKALGADTGYLFSGGDMLSGAKDMGMSGVKLAVSLADVAQQSPDAEIEASLKHLDKFLSGMGVFNNNAAAASSFSHLLKDLFMMGKNIAK